MLISRRKKSIFNIFNYPDTETVYGKLLQAVVNKDLRAVTHLIDNENANTRPTHEDLMKYDSYDYPLHYAAAQGSVEIIQVLLRAKDADINQKGRNHIRPLHEAIGHLKAVEFLVAHGADLDAASAYGETPLHRAIHLNETDTAKYFVRMGANIHIRHWTRGSALDMVDGKMTPEICHCKNEDLAQYMRAHHQLQSRTPSTTAFFSSRVGMHCDISDEEMAVSCFGHL